MPTGYLYVFLGEMSVKVFCLLFDWVVFLFLYELLVSVGNEALVGHIICKYFLPSLRSFLWSPLLCKSLLSLNRSHLFVFVFVSIALGERPKKTLV